MAQDLWTRFLQQLGEDLDAEVVTNWFEPLVVLSASEEQLVLGAPNSRFLYAVEEAYREDIDRAAERLDGKGLKVELTLIEEAPEPSPAACQFNENYTFDTFVVGASNQLAHAAAQAVAGTPSIVSATPSSDSTNPLFLYGGVGLGKTHLLHAIGHRLRRDHSNLRVLYLAAEEFVNDLITSLRFNRMPDFRERYRSIDVLLVDDVQFLANKERTQEEFFHTFNTLRNLGRQIILSSDAPPRDIPTLEERLRSRFEWGLIVDIQPPDLETKVAILDRKADQRGVTLSDDVAHYLARQARSNIRELEGLLNRVTAYATLTDKPLSLELAKQTVEDILGPGASRVTAQEIIRHVARQYGLKVTEIKSKNNSKHVAFPRQVAMYVCKQLTELSYPEIGRHFNDKHHSTVMYSVDKITKLRQEDPDLDRTVQIILDHFS